MQAIYDIAQLCSIKGISDAILSPGSRCAPLTISFARHPKIQTRTISDERSAAFIALGMARTQNRPVVLICTSGSAAYNYAPAVAEAYFQQIPLLILTADRPPEWIDQLDGQTIRQNNIYGAHVKGSFTTPVDCIHNESQWHINRIVSEAINLANEFPQGPVHINLPLREPFYPETEIQFSENIKAIEVVENEGNIGQAARNSLYDKINQYERILLVAGQGPLSLELSKAIEQFCERSGAVLISDTISNCQGVKDVISFHDYILLKKDEETVTALKPDLLITFGLSVISKSLKQFLRKHKPEHWHIQTAGPVADTYQNLNKIIREKPEHFLSGLPSSTSKPINRFKENWLKRNTEAAEKIKQFFSKTEHFSEFEAIQLTLQAIPENNILHLANSMPVRYVNYLGIQKTGIEVMANRGTSGIDGVISTALGCALVTNKMVTVITGDLTFFYDRNAFWNNYLPANLRIILLNNHGGGIFRIIDGPNKQPELKEYFETSQPLTASQLAAEYNIEHSLCRDKNSLLDSLKSFYAKSSGPKIIEIETDSIVNTEVFNRFKTV